MKCSCNGAPNCPQCLPGFTPAPPKTPVERQNDLVLSHLRDIRRDLAALRDAVDQLNARHRS